MYDSERYTLPLPRPFPVYIPRPSTSVGTNNSITTNNRPIFPQRRGGEIDGELLNDEFNAYHPDLSSTEISAESHQNELLASSELREFSCFSSYTSTLTDPGSNMVSSVIVSSSFAPVSVPHYVPKVSTSACGTSSGHVPVPMPIPMPMSMPMPMPMPECVHMPESELGGDCEGMSSRDEEESRKPPEERHRKRSKNWTRPETLKLIRVRSDIDSKFARSGRKSELWDLIAEALQSDGFSRDAQQCKDKWEKLCASYKEVGEGTREREDFIYYREIHSILSSRSKKRDREREESVEPSRDRHDMGRPIEDLDLDLSGEFGFREEDSPRFRTAFLDIHRDHTLNDQDHVKRSKNKSIEYISVADLPAVHKLMDTLLAKQQDFFAHLLDAMEKRDEAKEKLRQEREDKWRAEELEQKKAFNSTMITLIEKLNCRETHHREDLHRAADNSNDNNSSHDERGKKKRSRNWKRSEVLQLIKSRVGMDSKCTMPVRRGSLWDEISQILGTRGIQRDGKQCREKWDQLMVEFKEVSDGMRDPTESPFFLELKSFMEMSDHRDL